jgi:16S rRNA G966 N2-methylase RsmD
MDPPYNQQAVRHSLVNLHRSNCLAGGAEVIVEHSWLEPIPEKASEFRLIDQRRYGKTLVSILAAQSQAAGRGS